MIHIGFDFNAANCSGVAGFWGNKQFNVFSEFAGYFDTPNMIEAVKDRFQGEKIIAYPDATGIKRSSTNAAISDIALLKKAGFIIRAKSINPRVRDRISAVNRALEENKLTIDIEACPELVECLEQQVYKANGDPDKSSGFDHMVDALGYPIAYLMPVRNNKALKVAVAH